MGKYGKGDTRSGDDEEVDEEERNGLNEASNSGGPSAGIIIRVQGERVIDTDKALVAVAADACALCCLQCTGALVLILYIVQIGLWSWTFHEIYTGLPQTFAWEKLLRTYGSHYDDCIDRTGETEIELKPPDLCPNVYTMPVIPILAIVILILNLFSGTSCLSKPKSRRMYTMVSSSTMWEFIFTVTALVFVSLYFHTDEARLEGSMRRELSKGLPPTTRWQLTQIINKCCGIRNYSDWTAVAANNASASVPGNLPSSTTSMSTVNVAAINGTKIQYPASCYENQRQDSKLFKDPCYNLERSTVRFWAIFEIALLSAGLLTTTFFLCLATAVHGGARGNWKSDRCVGSSCTNSSCNCNDGGGGAGLYFIRSPSNRYGHHHFHHHGHHQILGQQQFILNETESAGFTAHQQQQQQPDIPNFDQP